MKKKHGFTQLFFRKLKLGSRRAGFTLIEIIIAVVVLSILSAIGAISWDAMVDKTRQDICEQNQTILVGALKFYIYDNQAAPTSLSSIYPKYTDFALAKMKKDHPVVYAKRAISLAMLRASQPKNAVAADISPYLGMQTSVLHCPEDNNGLPSYGLHNVFDGIQGASAINMFKLCRDNNVIIVADSDSAFFSDTSECVGRHGSTTLNPSRSIVVYATAAGTSGYASGTVNSPASFNMEPAENLVSTYTSQYGSAPNYTCEEDNGYATIREK